MSVLSKLKLSTRFMIPTMTPTPTPTPTVTPTPTPTIVLALTGQSANDALVNQGDSVAYASFTTGGGAYTIVWEVNNGSSRTVTVSTDTGTFSAGNYNTYGPNALAGQFYSYGSGPGQYYGEGGGAGYYRCTITVAGASVDTGFIRVRTRETTECNCGCRYYPGGPIVGEYLCYGGTQCTDNCCWHTCDGDCVTGYLCRAECSQEQIDYCINNYCECAPYACGQTCTCPSGTYYCTNSSTYYCETCYGNEYAPQYN